MLDSHYLPKTAAVSLVTNFNYFLMVRHMYVYSWAISLKNLWLSVCWFASVYMFVGGCACSYVGLWMSMNVYEWLCQYVCALVHACVWKKSDVCVRVVVCLCVHMFVCLFASARVLSIACLCYPSICKYTGKCNRYLDLIYDLCK